MLHIGYHIFNKSVRPLSPCQVRDNNAHTGRYYNAVFFSHDNMVVFIIQYVFPDSKNSVVLFRERIIVKLHIKP